MDSVSSSPSKGGVAPFQKFSPRTLMYYRGDNGCVMSLVWEEREVVRGPDKKLHQQVKVWHLLHRGPGGDVVHETLTREQAHHPSVLVPTASRTTPGAFEEYLRGVLRQFGGQSACWRLLGLEPPAHEPTAATPEAQKTADELYARAANLLKIPEDDLRKKYGHLNNGLQAMNLRNRLRGKGFNV